MLIRRLVAVLSLALCAGCPGRSSEGPLLPNVALTPAYVGEAYRAELAPSGGTAPLSFAVEGLPPGFSFHTPASVLEGTPRAPGVWGIRIAVTDADGRTDARTYSLELLAERAPGDGDAGTDAGSDAGTDAGSDAGTDAGSDAGTDAGSPAHLTIANWNVEWFGDLANGPTDEALQRQNAANVLVTSGADIWALGEIVSATAFNDLLATASAGSSTAYQGILANGVSVSGGSTWYSAGEQKVALVWKEGVLSDVSAEIILGGSDYDFAGRPPLKVEATATIDGVSVPLTFVVLHMKATDDPASFLRRQNAGGALKDWLDALPSGREVIVLGDWNDDVDVSITSGEDTPYRALVNSSRYSFLTEIFSLNNISTTTGFSTPIDHQLVTAPLAARHVPGSTQVVHPPISGFGYTTSDHFPVRSTFLLGMGDGSSGGSDGGTDAGSDGGTDCEVPRVLINEVYFNPPNDLSGQPDWASTYVELYNPGSQTVSLQNWAIHDYDSLIDQLPPRHVFGAKVLPAGGSLVIFSGASGAAAHPGIPTDVASSGEYRFNRNYRSQVGLIDAVFLLDASGYEVDFSYFATTALGISSNRSPDTKACSEELVLHDQLGGLPKSPGRRADGGTF